MDVKVKIPVQDRAFAIDPTAIDTTARTAAIIFATETPAPRWDWELGDYFEILDCSEKAADLSRLKNGGAFLSEHIREQQIGVHTEARAGVLDPELGVVCKGVVKFGNSAKAKEEFEDVKEGIRSKISVSYQPLEMVLEKTGDEGDFYRVTRWQALENSLVSVPLDDNCQVSRSAPDPSQKRQQITIHNPKNLVPMKIRNRSLFLRESDNGSNATSGSAPQNQGISADEQKRQIEVAAEKRAKEIVSERSKRDSEIDALVVSYRKRYKVDHSELAAQFKQKDEATLREFQDALIKAEGKPVEIEFPEGSGIEVGSERAAAPAQNGGRILTPGEAFVRSEQFRRFSTLKGQQRSCRVDTGMNLTQVRTTATTAIAGFTNPQYLAGIKLLGQQKPTIRDLVMPGQMAGSSIIYKREVSFTNAADMVAEGAAKPEASLDTEEITANAKKIAVWTKETDELVNDFPAFTSYANGRLGDMIQFREDAQLLNGDGTGQNLTGILNASGLQTQAKGSDTAIDAAYKASTKVRTGTSIFLQPDAYVFHPNDWQDIRLSRDGNNNYYGGGPFSPMFGESLWGLPVVVTTAISEGTGLVGAFRAAAQIFDKQGLVIETTNTDQDDFIKNLMTIRAEERLAFAIYYGGAFCQITGI